MPKGDAGPGLDAASVDAAITQVLQAERDARDSVQRCAAEAEGIVEQAHERARQIARRAAQRSVRVQRWSAAVLQRRLDELAAQHAQIEQSGVLDGAHDVLECAIETLAVHLTTSGQP